MTRCECIDRDCPSHPGMGCIRQATTRLFRADVEDETGTMFCTYCAQDAAQSGPYVFGSQR